MKFIIFIFLFFPFVSFAFNFEIERLPLPDAISVLWSKVLNRPFMIAPELVVDQRKVSFHITDDVDSRTFILRYLSNMNIKVSVKDGVDYIYPVVPLVPSVKLTTFVYVPKFRSVEYLSSVLHSAFVQNSNSSGDKISDSGKVDSVLSVQSPRFMNTFGDRLMFRGTNDEISQLKFVLNQFDVRADQVEIVAFVYEVNSSDHDGSGLSLVSKLINGRFDIVAGSRSGFDNYLQIKTPSLSALYELFRSDSRFHILSSPKLRVVSGKKAQFSVGSSVPVLSSVSYHDNTPVQSIDYRDSGVIFSVLPVVSSDIISLDISQQLSDFSKTDTGVDNSPTLIQRSVKTTINLHDGDVVILSGLAENKNTDVNTGLSFLPDFFKSKSNDFSKTDIVIFLQAKRVLD